MDLIDRAAIRREISAKAIPENCDYWSSEMDDGACGCAEDLLYILDHNIPSVDAVPVVRCKDCKHFVWGKYCNKYDDVHGILTEPEDFCSDGERRGTKHERNSL